MKNIIVLSIICIINISVQAQILTGYGLKLGLGLSNQTWNYETDIKNEWDNKTGLTARVFVDILDVPFFQVQGEAGYVRKGFEDKLPVTTPELPDPISELKDVSSSLDYINIAILAKLKLGSGLLSPYIIGGPQLNILVGKTYSSGLDIVLKDLNSTSAGYSVGAGIDILDILPVSFLVEYRYEKDFSDSYDPSILDIKNYSHIIMAGIRL